MMDDIEKTKPVDGAPADDGETGAGCDVCMPPIALVGAEDYDYKYLCMPSMVRALRRNQLQRATRHRRDGLDGVGLTGLFSHSIPATLDKAREARKMIDESGYDIRLEIDGGVSGANIKEVAEAGVDMFVAGSAIFRDPRTEEAYKKTIDAMRDELAAAKVPANKVAA